jgi:hypothetical protein
MVVAANRRAHTNHRTFEFWGAEIVIPGEGILAVLLDIEKAPAAEERGLLAAFLVRGINIVQPAALVTAGECLDYTAHRPSPHPLHGIRAQRH